MRKHLHIDLFDTFMLLQFIILIFTLNYSLGIYTVNFNNQNPFDLSENAIVLKAHKTNNVPYSDIVNLNENNEIRIIALISDEEILGVYDPNMYYYVNSTKIIMPVALRYFSNNDYDNKTNTAIAVKQCTLGDSQFEDMSNLEFRYQTDVINCLESSSLAIHRVTLIKNLFSISNEPGNLIYIDGDNLKQIKNTRKNFEKNGYKQVEIKEFKIKLFESLFYSYQSKYPRFLIISMFTLLLLYIAVCKSVVERNKKKVYLSILYGGSFVNTLFHMYAAKLFKNFIGCSILCMIVIGYIHMVNTNYISFLNCVKIVALYLFYEFVVYTSLSYLSYKKLKLKEGVKYND